MQEQLVWTDLLLNYTYEWINATKCVIWSAAVGNSSFYSLGNLTIRADMTSPDMTIQVYWLFSSSWTGDIHQAKQATSLRRFVESDLKHSYQQTSQKKRDSNVLAWDPLFSVKAKTCREFVAPYSTSGRRVRDVHSAVNRQRCSR